MIVLLLSCAAGVSAQSGTDQPAVQISVLTSGAVKVSYQSSSNAAVKLLIEKDGRKYSYNIQHNGTDEVFPLQLGNGDYAVSVMKQVEGNKYRRIYSETVQLSMKDGKQVYLNSIQIIKWDRTKQAVRLAQKLTKGLKTDQEKVKTIYNYIVKNMNYDFDKYAKLENTYLPDIDATLQCKGGICYDFSSLFAAMARSVGVPVKLVKGYTSNVKGYHAWNEVYDSKTGKWLVVDTAFDSQLRAAKAKYTLEKNVKDYSKVYEY